MKKNAVRKAALILALCLLLPVTGCTQSNQGKYESAQKLLGEGKYDQAVEAFSQIEDYENSSKYIMYIKAIQLAEKGEYELGIASLQTLGDFKDSTLMARYYTARAYEDEMDYESAADIYKTMATFRDCGKRYAAIPAQIQERTYNQALALEEKQDYESAADIYQTMLDYKDCAERYAAIPAKIQERIYNSAMELMHKMKYTEARKLLLDIQDYSDVETQLKECDYQLAIIDENNGNLKNACIVFSKLNGYKDADERVRRYENEKIKLESKAQGLTGEFPVIVFIDGTAKIIEVELGDSSTDIDAGFLAKVKEDANYLNQFVGKTVPVDEASIDVVAGATVTSKAVIAAVNTAYER